MKPFGYFKLFCLLLLNFNAGLGFYGIHIVTHNPDRPFALVSPIEASTISAASTRAKKAKAQKFRQPEPFDQKEVVLSAAIFTTPIPATPQPTPTTATPTPTPQPSPVIEPEPRKQNYSIAVFGDSMTDTMGENMDYLAAALKEKYPAITFSLYNYGVGSQNIIEANARFNSSFQYKTRSFEPITVVKPDILIISSFAYNPITPYVRDTEWIALRELVSRAREVTPHVYILAEIAPVADIFGKGPGGVDWQDAMLQTQVGHITELLQNAQGVAKNDNVRIIDVYGVTQGKREYVSAHDGIHPSIAGHTFTANLIANGLTLP